MIFYEGSHGDSKLNSNNSQSCDNEVLPLSYNKHGSKFSNSFEFCQRRRPKEHKMEYYHLHRTNRKQKKIDHVPPPFVMRACLIIVISLFCGSIVVGVTAFIVPVTTTTTPSVVRLLSTPLKLKNKSKIPTLLFMGKGDGKKKRKKKKPASSEGAEIAQVTPTAQRVSTDINVPIRLQIAYGQARKQRIAASQTSFRQSNNNKVQKTKYRKVIDEETEEIARQIRAERASEPRWDVILSRQGVSPLVMVDGYNLIHAWPRLKKWMVQGELYRARDALVSDLEDLKIIKGWRIEVVFDGAGRKGNDLSLGHGPGGAAASSKITAADKEHAKEVTEQGVRIVFSGAGRDADAYIEDRCIEALDVTKGKITGSLIVVSDDAMIRSVGQETGAHCMGCDRLISELKAVRAATNYAVEVAVAKANGHGVRPVQLRGTTAPGLFNSGKTVVISKQKRKEEKALAKQQQKEAQRKQIEDSLEAAADAMTTTSNPCWEVVPDQEKIQDE